MDQLFADGVTADLALNLSKELFMQIDSLTGRGEATLASFLVWLRSRIDNRAFGDAGEALLPPGCVRIMTIHQAKGLEFPAVAVPGIKKSASQGSGFFLSKQRGVFLGDKDDWGRGYKKLAEKEEEKIMQRQEERCLLYVAMTRAKDYLFVGSPYPEGKPERGGTPFVDVLKCAREEDAGTHEIRRIREVSPTDDMPDDMRDERTCSTASDEEISLMADWNSSRRDLQRLRGESPAKSSTLTFVTWRALETFDLCPLKYYYQYVAGMSEELGQLGEDRLEDDGFGGTAGGKPARFGPGGMTPMAFGTLIHKVLEETACGRSVTDQRVRELINQSNEPLQSLDEAAAHVSKIAEAFLRSSFGMVDHVECLEERFAVRLQRLVFRGVFDRVDRINGGYHVVDYKYGKEKKRYDFQIRFYAWAVTHIFNSNRVAGSLLFLGNDLHERRVRTNEESTAMVQALAEKLEEATALNQYQAAPGPVCDGCDFAGFCKHAG